MQQETLPQSVKKLEGYIYNIPAARKLNMLDRGAREAIITLTSAATASRAAISRYWGNDDTTEQAVALEEAILQLKVVNDAILAASSHDLLDVVDVAHLSALNEHILEQLG
jgi:hypothetical protein